MLENVEVVISDFAEKDVGDEFYDRGLANTKPSNQEDGVWRIRLLF
jgi:hypothetical protein